MHLPSEYAGRGGFALALLLCVAPLPARPLPSRDGLTRPVSAVESTGREVRARAGNRELLAQGLLDVTAPPYAADPSGRLDATAALQQAVKDARDARLIVHLPAGRYLVSGTIAGIQGIVAREDWPYEGFADDWVANASFEYPCVLRGPGTGGRAVLVLADGAPGFGDAAQPKPVVHLWARPWDETFRDRDQPSINFNQMIIDVDFELGRGNPGAVAILHQGAEGSVIEDVAIDATGAFAGVQTAPASGGGIHGVSVRGGRYGFYVREPGGTMRGSQPSPVMSGVRLLGQTEEAILYDGRGPLTVAGAVIVGAGIRADVPVPEAANGALNLVDVAIELTRPGPAVRSNRSVCLADVWIARAPVAVQVQDEVKLSGRAEGWLHVGRLVAPATLRVHPLGGTGVRTDEVWLDGTRAALPTVAAPVAGPPDRDALWRRHLWPRPFPSRATPGVVDVKAALCGAMGDGRHDDGPALQAAIDAHETVFLPRGTYAISKPLRLHARTKLIGVGNIQATITTVPEAPAFGDPDQPAPLIETDDDAAAETVLAFVRLLVPVRNPCVYALRWRAGRRSIVRSVYPIREAWHPHAPPMNHPLVRIEGSGGGRWFTTVLLHWWSQGPDYRHLRIEGTREPLAFYMLEAEHGRGTTQLEWHDARNIEVYSMRTEGDFGVLAMRQCGNVRIFGLSGNIMPARGYALFTIEDSRDFLVSNVHTFYKRLGRWGALGTAHAPTTWFRFIERPGAGQPEVRIPGTAQVALYQRGQPTGSRNLPGTD
jgi:hypothetical protein